MVIHESGAHGGCEPVVSRKRQVVPERFFSGGTGNDP
jgi:hypothetical protein